MTKIILVVLYALMLPLRVVGLLLGRDPLQLREPKGVESYWLMREGNIANETYFSQESSAEGCPAVRQGTRQRVGGGVGRVLTAVLLRLAKWHAPRPAQQDTTAAHRAGGQQDIPDEIYTLW